MPDVENDTNEKAKEKEDDLIILTTIADKAERYEDMCTFLKQAIISKSRRGEVLSDPQMNMLSVCYKNVVGNLRSQWRLLSQEASEKTQETGKAITEQFQFLIAAELQEKCDDILKLLQDELLPVAKKAADEATEKGKLEPTQDDLDKDSVHQQVFYLKMAGDYFRYICEFVDQKEIADEKTQKTKYEQAKENAAEFYKKALDVAQKYLSQTNPTRLGLALNASVCYYEILKEPKQACALAKKAFDEAIQKLDTLNDVNYKDSTLIMQLLRDNLTLWTSEADENGAEEQID